MAPFRNIRSVLPIWVLLTISIETSDGRRAPPVSQGPDGAEGIEFPVLADAKLIKQDCTPTANDPAVPLDDPFSGDLPDCARIRYRAHDGSCNNIAFPRWGATNSILKRLLEPDYADCK
ncbi:hypothetical protein RvY_03636-2 [Ramazzottius varieornatus]|uniref:BPTI/Kunitz inhibitor domain-containing protein n=1 Tax=Ramazzottius varieornatus TaxID=947166 RepID=A0A1D1UUF8_RAMVA|nr:hypothetical protein RvY_03636-2 [Ramazzottius varieornatus]